MLVLDCANRVCIVLSKRTINSSNFIFMGN